MKRRGVLTQLGALVAATVAGCTGAQPDSDSTPNTSARPTTTTATSTTTTTTSSQETTTTEPRQTSYEWDSDTGDARFSYSDGRCGTTEMAAIDVRESVVEVVGLIKTPTPCHKLRLAGVEYVASDDGSAGRTMEVTVTTDGQRDGACATCVGVVSYVATIDVGDEDFDEVRVVHKSMTGERTVATREA